MIEFEKKITMCPNCKGTQFSDFGNREHFGYQIHYIICEQCTLIIMKSQMTEERLEKFYREEYRKLYNNMEEPGESLIAVQTLRGRHLAKLFEEHSQLDRESNFNYLDIGCSAGAHLDAVKDLFPNASLYGVEPGDNFRKFCTEKGLLVFSSINELIDRKIKMDAICLSHVLEHIAEPAEYLMYLNKTIASDNCLLLIEVPNTLGGHMSFELAHPVCFYKRTLIDTCKLAGFENIRIIEHNVTSRSSQPQYLTGIFKKAGTMSTLLNYSGLNAKNVIDQRRRTFKNINKNSFAYRLKRKAARLFRDFRK